MSEGSAVSLSNSSHSSSVGQKALNSQLELYEKFPQRGNSKAKRSAKVILAEDTYTEDLEKIIQRDFYPDVPKVKAQTEYLQAVEQNDVEKLRELQAKYRPYTSGRRPTTDLYSTPATFDTPERKASKTPSRTAGISEDNDKQNTEEPENQTQLAGNESASEKRVKSDVDLPLDAYLSKNTSEDNAAFIEIMEETQKQHMIKWGWLYDKEKEHEELQAQALALPGAEQFAIDNKPKVIDTWAYKNRNSLMYVPDGVEETPEDKVFKKPKLREIKHENTRFNADPFNEAASQEALAQAAAARAQTLQGKVGADGKDVIPPESPQVGGYKFLATPSPAPGVSESPLMTWGEIEGTPFRLDGSDTPIPKTPGAPSYKPPDMPRRDRLALELAEKHNKAYRSRKETAMKKAAQSLTTPAPRFGSQRSTDRLDYMSPAAQRLANTKLGIKRNTDKALKASYTPSPCRNAGDKTPIFGSSKSSMTPTPGSSKRSVKTPADSITDNLLNLPKRQKAHEFF